MSFNPTWGRRQEPGRPVLAPRRRGALLPTLLVLGVLVVLVVIATRVWVDLLWFQSVGFSDVFTTTLWVRALLFLIGALLAGGSIALSLSLGYRTRPVYAPVSLEQASLDRYREQVEPLRRLATIVIPIAVGLIAGATASQSWKVFLLWRNRTPFGVEDPQFGIDIGFFVFTLPFLRFVLSLLVACVVLSAIAAFLTHYLYGGLRLQGEGNRTTTAARVHLSVLVGLFLVLRGASYWLDRYSLTTASHRLANDFTGMTYTDVNAVLPAKMFLAIAAVAVGLLFVASIWTRSWRLPAIGVSLLLICAIAVGGLYPAAVQRFQVRPSEQTREAPFIERNIKATRTAYGLAAAKVQDYDAQTTATSGQLRDDAETVPGIRLLDPALVSDAFRQLEQVRQYYAFPDALDVDRYRIGGESRDTVIAVRELELDGIAQGQRNWVNDHTYYTHGYGMVAAFGNQRTSDGKPVFYEGAIPPTGELGDYEPRIYFGEQSPAYSIVGAPSSATPFEFDYPDGSPAGNKTNTYTGKGGVPLSSFIHRAAFALTLQEQNILLSNRVNSESRILYDRSPRDRVKKSAPWLTIDGDPFPAVVDGRVKWILDGYTTTDMYPNAQKTTLDRATTDSITERSASVQALADERINYIRNSVKATVDAYDGSVTLYAWDDADPVLKTWMKAFPDTVQPLSKISAQLMSHLRYPEDLFKVQRKLFARYHVTNPGSFYGGGDFWRVPDDPTRAGADQPPYYLTLQMPGQDAASFSLTSTFIPSGTGTRNVLTAFAAVDANAGSTAGVKRPGYGEMRVLQLPKDAVVSGPGQVQNNFNANANVSQSLNLLRQGNSKVESGNLLTLPVGGGLLYVQPVYVRGAGTTSYPLLQKVLVSFGDKIGFADTLDEALNQVFGGDSGAAAGDGNIDGGGTTPPPTGGAAPTAQQQLKVALADAQVAIKAGQAALAKQDFTAYGQAQKALQDALTRAVAAEAKVPAGPATATPGATASPSPSASPTPSPPSTSTTAPSALSRATPVPTTTATTS